MITNQATVLVNRLKNRGVQERVNLDVLNRIKVPLMGQTFQRFVRNMIILGYQIRKSSKLSYEQAEDLLLSELNLKDWQPTKETIAVKSFAESFLSSDRFDAEYYQPKYDDLEDAITKYGFTQLKALCSNVSTGFPYDSSEFVEEGIDLIRINNITPYGLDLSNTVKIKIENSLLRPRDKVKRGEILISMSGTIGLCCCIPNEIDAFINQRIIKFKPINFNGDTLALIINSFVGKIQLQRVGTGGVQTNLSNGDILSIKIPALSPSIQQKISASIHQSFNYKDKSKQLLEIAKTGVERAIETDEATATAWMNQQLEALGINLTTTT